LWTNTHMKAYQLRCRASAHVTARVAAAAAAMAAVAHGKPPDIPKADARAAAEAKIQCP
jgi:hypothetical protein